MATAVLSATRRRNVSPTSSITHCRIEDVDCSAAAFDAPPEDGQFVQAPGRVAFNSHGDTFNAADALNPNAATLANSAGLAMVFQSAQHSDRQALGQTRVPVIRGALRCKTKLFSVADDAVALSHANNLYLAGCLLTVAKATDAVQGSANRIVLAPLPAANGGWVVGNLVGIVTDSVVSGTGELEIQLYDKPIYVTK